MREDEAHWRYGEDHTINLITSFEAYYNQVPGVRGQAYAMRLEKMWPINSRQVAATALLAMRDMDEREYGR